MYDTHISFEGAGRTILGLSVLIGLSYLMSSNRKKIDWSLVFTGLALQLVFALLVFFVPFVKDFFEFFARAFTKVTSFTVEGSKMLFAGLLDVDSLGFLFAFQVLPTIVFFSALTSLLYYAGILQVIVKYIAWIMNKTMRLSGAESLSAAANIFVGQTEAPLVVKPYIEKMTRSEVMCLMTGGMATIAGGVLASYIALLGGADHEMQVLFARHLLTASILSAPAALVISKIMVPETEPVDRQLNVNNEKIGTNALEAITNGTSEGLKLAINVGAMLLVFTAFVAMFNYILSDFIGAKSGLNSFIQEQSGGKYTGFNLQLIMGYLFAPLAWICGVASEDLIVAGQLLGEKTILNEFFAYASFGNLKDAGMFKDPKSVIILTYALCGFSNIASIGIQIGGISTIAPNQKTILSQLGVRALIAGTIACFMTATIAGMFYS
jgi:CNT family concentrative nucleoside transporter